MLDASTRLGLAVAVGAGAGLLIAYHFQFDYVITTVLSVAFLVASETALRTIHNVGPSVSPLSKPKQPNSVVANRKSKAGDPHF